MTSVRYLKFNFICSVVCLFAWLLFSFSVENQPEGFRAVVFGRPGREGGIFVPYPGIGHTVATASGCRGQASRASGDLSS